MQLPIVAPAPIVTAHAAIFCDLFENRCQFQHFQNYLTGLIVLDKPSLANITRGVLESADKTHLARFFSEAPWFQDQINDRRVESLLQQTQAVRRPKADALLILDDTLRESVGSLFDYGDRHYNHGEDTYPLAHNPVTSHDVSGPVRFPVALRLYRRYDALTPWETFVQQHSPDCPIPTTKQERARRHKDMASILPIETFYQDGKTHLGLDAYRMRNAEAIGTHWCLVFVAYSFLPLDCLASSPRKGGLPGKTIGEACRQQAQRLIESLILYAHERLQLGQQATKICASLFAKQQPVMAS